MIEPALNLPARLGKYELVEFLGGGMSHVYRAQDTVLGRMVAVKILTEAGCKDLEAKARFLQEARMAGSIVHENIISVYDFGEERGKPFIVMEFLRGESLRDAIRNGRAGDDLNKLSICAQIARAVDYIHGKKIIHRDIKPENLHIDGFGRIKLMDFGIAKGEGMSLTRAGFTLGTPYYMAPEQVLGNPVTPLVDIYAFGILMFELFSGVKPIIGDTVEKIFNNILYEPLNMDPLRLGGVSHAIQDVVSTCTAKNPADRFQSMGAVANALQHIFESLGGVPSSPSSGIGRGLLTPVSSRPLQPTSPPPPVPSHDRERAFNSGAKGVTRTESGLPALLNSLPAALRSQQALMAIVAVGVLVIMGMLYLILWLLKLV